MGHNRQRVTTSSHISHHGRAVPGLPQTRRCLAKLDYDNMARVVQVAALGIYRPADSTDTPLWNRENPKTAPYIATQEKAGAGHQAKYATPSRRKGLEPLLPRVVAAKRPSIPLTSTS